MYSKTTWKDRVVDPDTGAVVQEGTFMSAEHFNNMENGIAANDSAITTINGDIDDIEETLDTGVGTTISLTINQSTFVMKLALKNSEGTTLSEQSIDLPIESMVVNAEYVEATKSLVLTLQSGSTVTVPLSALINGLVNDTRKVAGIDLKDDITVSEMKTALGVDVLEQNKVDKTTVSAEGIAETTATITVPEKAKAVSVCTMKGKTQKVVQRVNSDAYTQYTDKGVTFTPQGNGKWKVSTGSSASSGTSVCTLNNIYTEAGSKYFICTTGLVKCTASISGYSNFSPSPLVSASEPMKIVTCVTTSNGIAQFIAPTDTAINETISLMVFNLTAMYGAGKEPTTISECKYLLENGFVEFGTGVLWNAANESVVSYPKNLLNFNKCVYGYYDASGKWYDSTNVRCSSKIPVIAGKTYYVSGVGTGQGRVTFWNGNTIVSNPLANVPGTFEAPSGATSFTFQLEKNLFTANTQIEIGTSATSFVSHAFDPHTAEIPISLTNLDDYGVGISDSVSNILDFSNGVYNHNCKEIDLGDCTWNLDGSGTGRFYTSPISDIKGTAQNAYSTDICSKYTVSTYERIQAKTDDKVFAGADSSKRIWIRDTSYTDAASFKTAMSGVKYVYELLDASKTTTDISDIIRPLKVESGGTVTFVNPHNIDCDTVVKYKKEV